MRIAFSTDWFAQQISDHINLDAPGIYEWRIEGVGVYIGNSNHLRRRLKEYLNNVRNIVSGLPYRKNNPDGFRVVHHHLYEVWKRRSAVTWTVLENCELASLNDRKQFWIDRRREEEKTGGPRVLNSN
jgi:hypothetical protein